MPHVLSVVMLSVIILNVIMLSVVAPRVWLKCNNANSDRSINFQGDSEEEEPVKTGFMNEPHSSVLPVNRQRDYSLKIQDP